jgi:hypothetical protein
MPSGSPNGQNADIGKAQADPRSVLAAMVAQRELSPDPVIENSPTAAADVAPDDLTPPAAADETGQNLSPEETVEAEAPTEESTESAAAAAAEPDAELVAAFKEFSPNQRQAALELAKNCKPGEIPRIATLLTERHQARETIEQLSAELEETKAAAANGAATAAPVTAAMPATVAKLKTVAEVTARLEEVQGQNEAIQDFLDANPGDAQAEYQIGDKLVTRAQLIQQRAAIRSELKALPQRQGQLEWTAKVAGQQQEVQKFLKEKVPQFFAEGNPVGEAARKLAKSDPYVASLPNRDFVALCLAVGEAELRKQLQPAAKPVAAKPNGTVPLGKPHANGAAAGKPANGNLATAISRHATERSKDSFAAILSATGR